MPAPTTASLPTAVVTDIPGRFSPVWVVDKRPVVGGGTASTATTSALSFLPRVETADANFSTPTNPVTELGTDYHVGEYDSLPESKLRLQAYDVGYPIISVLTGKNAPASATTNYGFPDLATASVDVVRQFADPNGNVFASMYMGDLVVDEFTLSLKEKAAAMEEYSLTGFNMMMFRGFIQTKCYVVQSGDVSAHQISLGSGILGATEAIVPVPVPGGSSPASYWIQTGRLNFLKMERYRAGTGYMRYVETTGSPVSGYSAATTLGGSPTGASAVVNFASGDIAVGDVFFFTYCTYKSNVTGFTAIPNLSIDTSDPIAVDTRLTPFTIAGNGIHRGSAFDMKITMKRERVEGVGDTDGVWGVPDAPDVTLSLDVRMTDMQLQGIMQNGVPYGTDNGGTVANDFFDPNLMTRNQNASSVAVVATINDPRNSGAILKTYTAPTAMFKTFDNSASSKNAITSKYSGVDRVGNITIAVTRA